MLDEAVVIIETGRSRVLVTFLRRPELGQLDANIDILDIKAIR